MRLKNGLRKKTIKAIETIKTILLIMNDKEKIKKALKAIDKLVDDYDYELDQLIISNQPDVIDGGRTIKDLEKIKKILEE